LNAFLLRYGRLCVVLTIVSLLDRLEEIQICSG
jgi:hypothetical protein